MIISILASRVGRDVKLSDKEIKAIISILASRVGRDRRVKRWRCVRLISILASRVGRDFIDNPEIDAYIQFQSSRPGWDATYRNEPDEDEKDISILASRVGRDTKPEWQKHRLEIISILASRVGRDTRPRQHRPQT